MSELDKRGEVLLFNPIHDKLGRFARKTGGGNIAKGFTTRAVSSTVISAASFLVGKKVGIAFSGANLLSGVAELAEGIERRSFESENIREYKSGKGESAHYTLVAQRNKRAAEIQIGHAAAKVIVNGVLIGVALKAKKSLSDPELTRSPTIPDDKKLLIALMYHMAKEALADGVDEVSISYNGKVPGFRSSGDRVIIHRDQLEAFVRAVDES